MSNDLESWDLVVDDALGQARSVLETATARYKQDPTTEHVIAGGIELAGAWRDLADAWESRQAHELDLAAAMAETEDEETDEDEELTVDPRRPQARTRR